MVRRVVAGAAALGLAVGIAVVAGSGVGEPPVPLPVLGASAGTGATAADRGASSTGAAGVAYEVEGDLPELAGEAHAWSVGREADLARIAALAEALGFPGRCAPPASGGRWPTATGSSRWRASRGCPGRSRRPPPAPSTSPSPRSRSAPGTRWYATCPSARQAPPASRCARRRSRGPSSTPRPALPGRGRGAGDDRAQRCRRRRGCRLGAGGRPDHGVAGERRPRSRAGWPPWARPRR